MKTAPNRHSSNRRRADRAPIAVPVTVLLPGAPAVTSTLNLAAGGALIRPVPGLAQSAKVRLRVLLAEETVELVARVVRAQREFWAVEFVDPAPETLAHLHDAVQSRLVEIGR